ncbi:T9SS type A sorting domain-containing protein [Chryseobacterium sp.]|uniref:T9SS type A sorting domain-containing protein n=1 Tax=Chryseobacterium sp. TaxID=1871047 RepID=UPI0035C762C0
MKKSLLHAKHLFAAAMIFSGGLVNAQQWLTTGNAGTTAGNYAGTTGATAFYLRTNGTAAVPGQAILNEFGSFIVDGDNNTNIVKSKGNIVAGAGNTIGAGSGSSLVSGWGNNLAAAAGANLVSGQDNVVLNNASKSVALGWKNVIRNANQFAIGVGIDLGNFYSGGFGIDLAATGDRSFVIGSGTGGTKLTNSIPRSIMFGMSPTSTMLIVDQYVGVRTTAPTANFHTVGTVRLQGLPNGSGRALVVDNDGNVMVATSTITRQENNETDYQIQIDELKNEIKELKELLKQNKMSVDMSSEAHEAKLYQNAPIPGKGETIIKYYLPKDTKNASIEIYNASGQVMKTISLKEKGNGSINLSGMRGGSYVYSLIADGKIADSKKMLIQE